MTGNRTHQFILDGILLAITFLFMKIFNSLHFAISLIDIKFLWLHEFHDVAIDFLQVMTATALFATAIYRFYKAVNEDENNKKDKEDGK